MMSDKENQSREKVAWSGHERQTYLLLNPYSNNIAHLTLSYPERFLKKLDLIAGLIFNLLNQDIAYLREVAYLLLQFDTNHYVTMSYEELMTSDDKMSLWRFIFTWLTQYMMAALRRFY